MVHCVVAVDTRLLYTGTYNIQTFAARSNASIYSTRCSTERNDQSRPLARRARHCYAIMPDLYRRISSACSGRGGRRIFWYPLLASYLPVLKYYSHLNYDCS